MRVKVRIRDIVVPPRKRPLGDVSRLSESIKELGLLHPITLTPDRRLVAGLHRLEACRRLGWRTIEAVILDLDEIRTELVELDENLARQDLTVLERGEFLARRKEIHEALHPEVRAHVAGAHAANRARGRDAGEIISPAFTADAAARLGVARRTVEHEVMIATRIPPEVRNLIRGTRLADSKVDLLDLARADPADQRRAVRMLLAGRARDARGALMEIGRGRRLAGLRDPGPLGGDGVRFPIILADPPWPYEQSRSRSRRIDSHYETMPLAEITALPVGGVAAEDCVLFLWSPSAKVGEAIDVIRAWGFSLRTTAVWVKPSIGPGYYFRQRHELLLVATRGEPPAPAPKSRPPSVIEAPRGRHSEKPAEVCRIIEAMYPDVPRLELFQRRPRAGWRGWGNEAGNLARFPVGVVV